MAPYLISHLSLSGGGIQNVLFQSWPLCRCSSLFVVSLPWLLEGAVVLHPLLLPSPVPLAPCLHQCTSAAATTLIHHSGISSQEWTPYWPSDFFFYWCFVCLLALELIAPHLVIAQLDYPKENINKALLFDHDPYLFIVDPKTGEQGELLGAAQ